MIKEAVTVENNRTDVLSLGRLGNGGADRCCGGLIALVVVFNTSGSWRLIRCRAPNPVLFETESIYARVLFSDCGA